MRDSGASSSITGGRNSIQTSRCSLGDESRTGQSFRVSRKRASGHDSNMMDYDGSVLLGELAVAAGASAASEGHRWARDWLLRFSDARLEASFIADVSRKRRRKAKVLLTCFCIISLVEFFASSGLRRMVSDDPAGQLTSLSRLAVLGLVLLPSWVLLVSKVVSVETALCAASYLAPPLLFLAHEYRASELLGSNFFEENGGQCGARTCSDDTVLVLMLLVVCSVPLVCTVRMAKAVYLLPYCIAVYAAFSITGLGPGTIAHHGTILMLLSAEGVLLMLGCHRMEADLRERWMENLKLRIKVEVQRLHMVRQRAWAEEIEEQLLAATAPQEHVRLVDLDAGLEEAIRTVPILKASPPASRDEAAAPNALLVAAMSGKSMDVKRLRRMSERISDVSYSLMDFFEDSVETFPELALFFADPESSSSSGLSAEVEYQRTVGALFAVYWLARLDLDGKEGFCFGHDQDWRPYPNADGLVGEPLPKRQGRVKFYGEMGWAYMDKVRTEALGDSCERLQAMLCLTAFHDIMKVPNLCPRVAPEHAPYQGHAAGETIHDHDLALAYVLDKYPDLLPSFRELPQNLRDTILFTQGKMHFNHGWFVQAEATPGAMLAQFKAVLHKATPADLAFYFFHWLTDLAGAEGRPLAGAEKFVLRFPRAVLSSFLWSIPFLQQLAQPELTETDVMQRYLEARFRAALPEVPLPVGPEAVAIMRLVVMAQSSGPLAREAFQRLPPQARGTLAVELARTGLRDQFYTHSRPAGGPALFIYYGPALLQLAASPEEMFRALVALAGIYRAARCLWPVSLQDGEMTVRLEAGSMKAHGQELVSTGLADQLLVVERLGLTEGIVHVASGRDVNELLLRRAQARAAELQDDDWLAEGRVANEALEAMNTAAR